MSRSRPANEKASEGSQIIEEQPLSSFLKGMLDQSEGIDDPPTVTSRNNKNTNSEQKRTPGKKSKHSFFGGNSETLAAPSPSQTHVEWPAPPKISGKLKGLVWGSTLTSRDAALQDRSHPPQQLDYPAPTNQPRTLGNKTSMIRLVPARSSELKDAEIRLAKLVATLQTAEKERNGALHRVDTLDKEVVKLQTQLQNLQAANTFSRITNDEISEAALRDRILSVLSQLRETVSQWSGKLWEAFPELEKDLKVVPGLSYEAKALFEVAKNMELPLQSRLLDEALVQVAFGFFCARIWEPFFPGHESTMDLNLKKLFKHLRTTEDPTVSSKWRSVTFSALDSTAYPTLSIPLTSQVLPPKKLVELMNRCLTGRIEDVLNSLFKNMNIDASTLPEALGLLTTSLGEVMEKALVLKYDAMLRAPLVESEVLVPSITVPRKLETGSLVGVDMVQIKTWAVGREPTVTPPKMWTVKDFWDL